MVKSGLKPRILGSKKAVGIEDAIPLIIFIFVGAIIFGAFMLFDNTRQATTQTTMKNQIDKLDANEILAGFLAKVDEKGNTNADLILKLYIDKEKNLGNEDVLKNNIRDYFGERLSHWTKWKLQIDQNGDYSKNIMTVSSDDGPALSRNFGLVGSTNEVSEFLIPVSSSEYLSITLFFEQQ